MSNNKTIFRIHILSAQICKTVWQDIFAGSNVCDFFPAIHKNKFPQMKVTANIFPAQIYSRVNIL